MILKRVGYIFTFSLMLSLSQADSIDQKTKGSCSPTVNDTEGNVTINCHGVLPKIAEPLPTPISKRDTECSESIRDKKAHSYISYKSDIDKDEYEKVNNRFKFNSDCSIYDSWLNKKWLMFKSETYTFEESNDELKRRNNGYRLPTVKELRSLITKIQNQNDWGRINSLFFKEHSKTIMKFWTNSKPCSGWVCMFYPNLYYYVDFRQAKTKQMPEFKNAGIIAISDCC